MSVSPIQLCVIQVGSIVEPRGANCPPFTIVNTKTRFGLDDKSPALMIAKSPMCSLKIDYSHYVGKGQGLELLPDAERVPVRWAFSDADRDYCRTQLRVWLADDAARGARNSATHPRTGSATWSLRSQQYQ